MTSDPAQPPLLGVRVESDGGSHATITLTGEVDDTTAGLLEDALASVLPTPNVTIDVAGVTFIDSSGFRTLVTAHNAAPSTTFELVNPSELVVRLVDLLGLADIFATRTSA